MTLLDPTTSLRIAARARWLHEQVADAIWSVIHANLGTHRWREGYEVNVERGWRRYRGLRCAICDEPWEGW
jgi:hypothetical protein